jgi:UDP-N-acetyl-D-glucosamine dehydrogenase
VIGIGRRVLAKGGALASNPCVAPPDSTMMLAGLIDRREATVAVVGLGYVGLPVVDAVVAAGFRAIGIDRDPEKIATLERGGNYLPHLGPDLAHRVSASGRARFASDRSVLRDADVVVICVPTPLDADRKPDLSAVESAARDVHRYAVAPDPGRARLVVLVSTTWPGTTREVVRPLVLGSHEGAPIALAFSPEREDPGRTTHTTRTVPRLVGGLDDGSRDLAMRFFGAVVDRPIACASAEVAEAAKLLENIYRSVNIALVNEMKVVLGAMGIDVWEVVEAAATKPYGFARFDPGPGFGGHCVPIDPFYLAERAREFGVESRFIELAGEVNHAMPGHVVRACEAALRDAGKELRGARVLVLGLAYKKNIADVRESPAAEIIELVREAGAEVCYHDPHVARTHAGRRHDLKMESAAWSAEMVAAQDLVVIATDHDWYDWDFVGVYARLIVDTRNAMAKAKGAVRARVVKA